MDWLLTVAVFAGDLVDVKSLPLVIIQKIRKINKFRSTRIIILITGIEPQLMGRSEEELGAQ